MYMIMFASRGLGYGELSVLMAVWAAPVVLLEVPSGLLADAWSARGSMALGMVLKAAAFALWAAVPGFAGAAAGFVLWGCQEAFCSGAFQALLYERLAGRGLADSYERAAGLCGAAGMTAAALSMASGGFIYAASPFLALALSSAAAGLGIVAALALPERRKVRASQGGAPMAGIPRLLAGRAALPFLLAFCVAGAISGTIDEYDGLWGMERYRVPLAMVGAWSLLPFLARALGGAMAGRVAALLGPKPLRPCRIAIASTGGLFILSALLPGFWGALPYLAFCAVAQALAIFLEARLQETAPPKRRATFISAANLALTLCAMAYSPAFGLVAKAGGLRAALALSGGAFACAALALPATRRSRPRGGSVSRRG
jgi:MFS family permease